MSVPDVTAVFMGKLITMHSLASDLIRTFASRYSITAVGEMSVRQLC